MAWKLTIRNGPEVAHSRYDDREAALRALEDELRAVATAHHRGPVKVLSREFAPVQQVIARAQLAGPKTHAGVDVRGDGSAEAWTGRWRRRLVEIQPGEDAYAALRRALQSSRR